MESDSRITVNSKLNMRFPINRFLGHHSTTTIKCQVRLKLADITYFISVSVALRRRFDAASKKENNNEGVSIHFLMRSFLNTTPSQLTHKILMKRIKLLRFY